MLLHQVAESEMRSWRRAAVLQAVKALLALHSQAAIWGFCPTDLFPCVMQIQLMAPFFPPGICYSKHSSGLSAFQLLCTSSTQLPQLGALCSNDTCENSADSEGAVGDVVRKGVQVDSATHVVGLCPEGFPWLIIIASFSLGFAGL